MFKPHWFRKSENVIVSYKKPSPESSITIKKQIQKKVIERQTIRDLYKKRKLETLVHFAKHLRGIYEEYDQIKVKGETIRVNDAVLINSGKHHDEDYIGTIQSIITIKEPTTAKLICLSKVQWYMRKSEIIKSKPKCQDWISEQELFLTNHSEYILAQTIIQSCKIIPCNEYLELEETDSTLYFCRLDWDIQKKQFNGLETLQQYCVCKQPVNPDRQYIQCDKCNRWFHFECVGIKDEQIENKEFYCQQCL